MITCNDCKFWTPDGPAMEGKSFAWDPRVTDGIKVEPGIWGDCDLGRSMANRTLVIAQDYATLQLDNMQPRLLKEVGMPARSKYEIKERWQPTGCRLGLKFSKPNRYCLMRLLPQPTK